MAEPNNIPTEKGIKGKAKIVVELVNQALNDGIGAKQILEEGLLAGMNVIGEKFQKNEFQFGHHVNKDVRLLNHCCQSP